MHDEGWLLRSVRLVSRSLRDGRSVAAAELLRGAADAAPFGVALRGADGSVVYANAAFRRAFPDDASASRAMPLGDGRPAEVEVGSAGGARRFVTVAADAGALRLCVAIDVGPYDPREAPRDEVVSVAAHELRAPLAGLRAVLSDLTEDVLGVEMSSSRREALAARLDDMGRRLGSLSDLVVSLLASSRLHHRGLDGGARSDLGGIALAVVRDMAPHASSVGSEVSVTAPEVLGPWAPEHVSQVVTNLLSNALRYGAGSPVEVTVSREGDRAVLVVRDHGVGIDPADHERIFGRFVQVVLPVRRVDRGVGLGLWVVRRLVEAYGGSVSVQSEAGRGAAFRVELPISPG